MKTVIFASESDRNSMQGTFEWPAHVEVVFPNGERHDIDGARDNQGVSLDYNKEGRGDLSSPCGQALISSNMLEQREPGVPHWTPTTSG